MELEVHETPLTEFPAEIESHILHLLPKTDLLTCRLVCKSWNQESLHHLRKSNFTQPLNQSNIVKFLEFSKNSLQPPQFVLPFHLAFDSKRHPPYIFSSEMDDEDEEQLNATDLKKFGENIDALFGLFGFSCVASYKIRWPIQTELDLIQFYKILIKINTHLKTLDLCGLRLGINREDADAVAKSHNFQQIQFPNLTVLRCKLGKSFQSPSALIPAVIANCNSIQKLIIMDSLEEEYQIPLEGLKILKIKRFLDYRVSILYTNRSHISLQKFEFGITGVRQTEQITLLWKLLESFSTTLTTLNIRLCPVPGPQVYIPPVPTLRNLKHIRFILPKDELQFCNEEFNCDLRTFPNLQRVDIPFGFCFTKWNDVCPQVNELVLRVRNVTCTQQIKFRTAGSTPVWDHYPSDSLTENLSYLEHTFPNVSIVTIANECRGLTECLNVEQVIFGITSTLLANQIEYLTIKNYYNQEGVGSVLRSFEDLVLNSGGEAILKLLLLSHGMKKIKRVRLEKCSSKYFNQCRAYDYYNNA